MKRYAFLMLSFTFASTLSLANETGKSYQYIEVSKGLDWLSKNATRIASVTVEKEYKDDLTDELISVKSQILAPQTAEECQNSDINDEYTNFFLHVSSENIDPKSAGVSRWFDGEKLNGAVTKQVVVYCFAN